MASRFSDGTSKISSSLLNLDNIVVEEKLDFKINFYKLQVKDILLNFTAHNVMDIFFILANCFIFFCIMPESTASGCEQDIYQINLIKKYCY